MEASENVWLRPRLPLAGASHCMSLSSQMLKSPLAFSAALYAFQFVVRYLRRPQIVSLVGQAYIIHLSGKPTLATGCICATTPTVDVDVDVDVDITFSRLWEIFPLKLRCIITIPNGRHA